MTDIDDHAPVFITDHPRVTVTVDMVAQGLSLYTAHATDADVGNNAELHYVISTNPNMLFNIDNYTGEVRAKPNVQISGAYDLVIMAIGEGDGKHASLMYLHIDVEGEWPRTNVTTATTTQEMTSWESTASPTSTPPVTPTPTQKTSNSNTLIPMYSLHILALLAVCIVLHTGQR